MDRTPAWFFDAGKQRNWLLANQLGVVLAALKSWHVKRTYTDRTDESSSPETIGDTAQVSWLVGAGFLGYLCIKTEVNVPGTQSQNRCRSWSRPLLTLPFRRLSRTGGLNIETFNRPSSAIFVLLCDWLATGLRHCFNIGYNAYTSAIKTSGGGRNYGLMTKRHQRFVLQAADRIWSSV